MSAKGTCCFGAYNIEKGVKIVSVMGLFLALFALPGAIVRVTVSSERMYEVLKKSHLTEGRDFCPF
jgi:hypothetical protein